MPRYLTTADIKKISELTEATDAAGSWMVSIDDGTNPVKYITLTNLMKLLVPYSGAVTDLLMGAHDVTAMRMSMTEIFLSTTPPAVIPTTKGACYWDADADTWSLVLSDGVVLQLGEENYTRCARDSAAPNPIVNGTPVYITGESGQRPKVDVARADDITKMHVAGVSTHDIANLGRITTFGLVRAIPQTVFPAGESWVAGDKLWLAPTGGMTNVEPAAPTPNVQVGLVLNVTGSATFDMLVCVVQAQGLYSLYDVNGDAPDTTNQMLVWNNTLSYWTKSDALITLLSNSSVAGSILNLIKLNAQNADYDHAVSGLSAVTLKTAIDELDGFIDTLKASVSTSGSVLKSIKDNAKDATFTPIGTIAATDIKGAIAEVSGDVEQTKLDLLDLRTETEHEILQIQTQADTVAKSVVDASEIFNLGSPNVLGVGVASNFDTAVSVTAQDGAMEATLEGKTGTNEGTNLSFENSLTGWTDVSGGGGYASTQSTEQKLDGANSLKIAYANISGYRWQQFTIPSGSVAFISVWAYLSAFTSGTSIGLIVRNAENNSTIASSYVNTATVGAWQRLSVIIAAPSANLIVRLGTVSTVTLTIYFDAVQFINLTSLGLATLLNTAAKAQAYFSNYHPATLGVGEMRYRTVGKNLCPTDINEWEQGTVNALTGVASASTTSIRTKKYHRILSSVIVSPSQKVGSGLTLYAIFFDENLNYVSYTITTNYTIPSNARFVRYRLSSATAITTTVVLTGEPQLELGSTATTYEAYKDSTAWTPEIGNRLPNAVHDEYDVGTGIGTQNVFPNYVLQSADITDVLTNGSNAVIVSTREFSDLVAGNLNREVYSASYGYQTNYVAADNADNIGKLYVFTGNKYIRFGLPVGTTLAQARTALAGTVIYYQLATPITTQYDPQSLQSFLGGSMYLTNGKRDGMVYASGLTFLYDVLSVDLLYKFSGGVKVPITNATISGKVVSSVSLADGDICYIEVTFKTDQSLLPVAKTKVPYKNLRTEIDSLNTPSTTSTALGYETIVDVASGATATLPAGGTFRWEVYGYGANIGGAKRGTASGGATLTMAGANGSLWYRRLS